MSCIRDMSFGRLLRGIRIKNGLTLRAAAIATGWDAGNLSKLERGLLAPPSSWKAIHRTIKNMKSTDLDKEFLRCAAFNFHLGKLQEKFE